MKKSSILIGAVIVFVGFVVWVESDHYYRLFNQDKRSEVANEIDIAANIEVFDDVLYEDTGSFYVGDSSSSTGINLMLMNNLTTESYVKELLTLYLDLGEGKLTNYEYHPSLEVLLGMHSNETGFYPESNNMILKSYLPWGENAPVWDTEYAGLSAFAMTLRGFGELEHQTLYPSGLHPDIDSIGYRSVFQVAASYEESGSIPKSLLDGASNAGRTTGQLAYLPDVLAYEDRSYNEMLNIVKLDPDTTPAWVLNSCFSMYHNRGGGGMSQLSYGIAYQSALSDYCNLTLASEEEKMQSYGRIANVLWEYYASLGENPDYGTYAADTARWITFAIVMRQDGWYFSDLVARTMTTGYSASASVRCWNMVNPDLAVESADELLELLSDRNKDLYEAINEVNGTSITAEDTERVYNTSTDYDDCPFFQNSPSNAIGYVYYVSSDRGNVYINTYSDGSKPFLVSGYDLINLGYHLSAVVFGPIVYANMLKFAGVGVDITDPSTYLNGLGEDTFRPGNTDWMVEAGVDVNSLSQERREILEVAYSFLDLPYVYGARGQVLDDDLIASLRQSLGTSYYSGIKESDKGKRCFDCSGFIYAVYNELGYDIEYNTTYNIFESPYWENIPIDELEPGDIVCYRSTDKGHVLMYVSGEGLNIGNYLFIDAPNVGQYVSLRHYTSSGRTFKSNDAEAQRDGYLYAFRYTGF